MLERTLVELGLHDTEARFYLAALALGEAPIREIAEKAGISRTNAYDVLARLEEQGLATSEGDGPRNLRVVPVPPERLAEIFDNRRRRLEAILPDLRSLHIGGTGRPRVRYHEGLAGIQSVLEETLACRSKLLFGILSMRDLYEVPGRAWMDEHVRHRIAAGIELRVVRARSADVHARWQDSPEELRELRYAPEGFDTTMTTYVYDDTVSLISSGREHFAMTIESGEFAALQRQLFEALWHASTPAVARRPRTLKLGKMA
jgi:HTH-type transcriptional regulator, sugar sensing transcriptional regulator